MNEDKLELYNDVTKVFQNIDGDTARRIADYVIDYHETHTHRTQDGYCCACEADLAFDLVQAQKALEEVKQWISDNHEHHDGSERVTIGIESGVREYDPGSATCTDGNSPYVNSMKLEKFINKKLALLDRQQVRGIQ